MHISIWRFQGDPDELLRSYERILSEIPPQVMVMHACLRAPDGLVLIDSCPTKADLDSFANGRFVELRRRHGLPDPVVVEDFPLHAGFLDGRRI
jgi:hypothetical protein